MSAAPGRRRAPSVPAGKALLQSWVPVELHEKVSKAASAAGISVAYYLQLLVAHDQVDANGCPKWLPASPESQEELPLKTA